MARPIPDHFDVATEALDSNETYVRDVLKVDIGNWARFRYTINLGLHAENLQSDEPIPKEVKGAYRELGKSHYAAVCALGHTRLALTRIAQAPYEFSLLYWSKALKDFYYHAGRLIDNLARLIYIVNAADGARAMDSGRYIRHWVGWGQLSRWLPEHGYDGGDRLAEIRNLRNVLTHSWDVPTVTTPDGPIWPEAVRTERDHLWFYDERDQMRERYPNWIPILPMVAQDFQFLESFQNEVFARLVEDIHIFEENYHVVIQ